MPGISKNRQVYLQRQACFISLALIGELKGSLSPSLTDLALSRIVEIMLCLQTEQAKSLLKFIIEKAMEN